MLLSWRSLSFFFFSLQFDKEDCLRWLVWRFNLTPRAVRHCRDSDIIGVDRIVMSEEI